MAEVPPGQPAQPAEAAAAGRDVFLCHASQDAVAAIGLVEKLESAGVTCWIAPRDVTAGTLYADSIVRAINGTRCSSFSCPRTPSTPPCRQGDRARLLETTSDHRHQDGRDLPTTGLRILPERIPSARGRRRKRRWRCPDGGGGRPRAPPRSRESRGAGLACSGRGRRLDSGSSEGGLDRYPPPRRRHRSGPVVFIGSRSGHGREQGAAASKSIAVLHSQT